AGLHERIDLQLDIPSVCAEKLKNKTVDIGLIPVALLPELSDYHIISDYCIGADGKVDSVKLYSHVPLKEIDTILLDYQSKTSVTLVQVLSREYWKIKPEFTNTGAGFEEEIKGNTAAVVIGDRTFAKNGTYPYEFDLAEEWKDFTGLPFVFAAWVSLKELNDNDFINTFNIALTSGLMNIDKALIDYHNPVIGFDPTDYLKNKISYPLDEAKRAGLLKFLGYLSL
ncbi:MAG TPA: menaquinone biosynthesis protein, partial [Nitrosopumilaceae archaeon]|nr:menaquinone biosynthesis protein [Nitrosopumilaceae archaeon]